MWIKEEIHFAETLLFSREEARKKKLHLLLSSVLNKQKNNRKKLNSNLTRVCTTITSCKILPRNMYFHRKIQNLTLTDLT